MHTAQQDIESSRIDKETALNFNLRNDLMYGRSFRDEDSRAHLGIEDSRKSQFLMKLNSCYYPLTCSGKKLNSL